MFKRCKVHTGFYKASRDSLHTVSKGSTEPDPFVLPSPTCLCPQQHVRATVDSSEHKGKNYGGCSCAERKEENKETWNHCLRFWPKLATVLFCDMSSQSRNFFPLCSHLWTKPFQLEKGMRKYSLILLTELCENATCLSPWSWKAKARRSQSQGQAMLHSRPYLKTKTLRLLVFKINERI